MARHTWHRSPNRYQEADYRALTAGARCLLRDLDEVLWREDQVTANVSTLAGWFGLDRKTTREGVEAIARTSLLSITKEERVKAGTFYTITNPTRTPKEPPTNPEPTPDQPQADPEPTPDGPQTNPKQAPHTSAINAGSGDSSYIRREGEIKREEEKGSAHADGSLPAPTSPEVSELETWWAALKGRIPPLSPAEIGDIRDALSIPGQTLDTIKASVKRMFDTKKAKGDPPATFRYFLRGLRDDAERRALMAAPIQPSGSNSQPRAAPAKPRIRDQDHYDILAASGMLDPDDWVNLDEFAPKEASA